jgi:ribose transport system substrate-binding protein
MAVAGSPHRSDRGLVEGSEWADRVVKNNHNASFSTLAKRAGTYILDMEQGNWHRDDSCNVVQNFLSREDQIDAVWTSGHSMPAGVRAAIEAAGRNNIDFRSG